jgi:hypothetical protein
LVLQEVGVVVVNLGIVGQSLNSRPKINTLEKEYSYQIPHIPIKQLTTHCFYGKQ